MAERQKSYLKAEQDAYKKSMPGAPKGFGGRREVSLPRFPSDRRREVTTQGRGFGLGRVMPGIMEALMKKARAEGKGPGLKPR